MLTVVTGEDIQKARNYFVQLKNEYKKKEYLVQEIKTVDLIDIYKSSTGVVDLFGQESVYVIDSLSTKYAGRGKTEFKDIVQEISKHKTFHLLDWEGGKSAYDLTSLKKISSKFEEFKPDRNIFMLLDTCYPGNLNQFISLLNAVHQTQDIMFIYTLLWRHIRKLILAYENVLDSKTPPWQRGKISSQAKSWDKQKLINFYEGLIRIDFGMKTSTSTFNVKDSIEILACHYLKK